MVLRIQASNWNWTGVEKKSFKCGNVLNSFREKEEKEKKLPERINQVKIK